MKKIVFLIISIGLMPVQAEAFFASSNSVSLWQRIKKNVVQAGDNIKNVKLSQVITPSTQKIVKKYIKNTHKVIFYMGQAIDYGYCAAIALYPFIDRYCMKKAPSWMATNVSPEFKTFMQNELREAGLENVDDLYIKCSPLADAHMAASFSHGIIVSKNLHDVWHEINGISYTNQKENRSLFSALIDLDLDMIRFIIRREATHIKNKDHLKRTALLAGIFALGKWSEHGRNNDSKAIGNQSWKNFLSHWAINRLKNFAYMATSLYAYSRIAIPQEERADMQAACTHRLANAGAEYFDQMDDVEEVIFGEKLYNLYKKYPAIYQMMLINKRAGNRAEYLHARADAFNKSDS